MTRRLQTCARCGGKTRHADQRCSACRHRARSRLLLGGRTSVRVLHDAPADLRAPTVAELNAGFEISGRISRVELVSAGELERWRFAVDDVPLAEVGGEVVHVDFRGRGA